MPTIGKTKSNPIVPKELKSILKGIISVPYNFAKNTLTFGTEATASSALLLTETISNSYLKDEKLTQKKDTLQIKLNEENQKVMEKNDEIRELLILVSDNVNISVKML